MRAASAITWLPFAWGGSSNYFLIGGRPFPSAGQEPVGDIRGVAGDYFRTMQIPLVRGSAFTGRERAAQPKVVVINEALARTYFRGQDPLGQAILMLWGDTLRGTVIGVVGDTRSQSLVDEPRPTLYWAMPQFPSSFMSVVVRGTGDPLALAPGLRDAAREIDPDQPLADVKPMDDYLAASVAQRRFTLALSAAFAGIALLLAAVGVYGVLAYTVTQRTREIVSELRSAPAGAQYSVSSSSRGCARSPWASSSEPSARWWPAG